MRIKNVTIKSDSGCLSVPNFSVKEFHKLISELNRLNPDAPVAIIIYTGNTELTGTGSYL